MKEPGPRGSGPHVPSQGRAGPAHSISLGTPRNIDAPLAIPVAALAGLAGVPDHRSGDGTHSSADDRALDWVASHGGADCSPTQSAYGSTLFRAGTCSKRNQKA
ncbi:hypothetical protein MesoLj113b_72560 (plasmid) [Mesorhizobium sp. 113-3-3]|nr:hypothetical protein MesoLj113b_72560 [Mesorhizobium sp. 113-3-3]